MQEIQRGAKQGRTFDPRDYSLPTTVSVTPDFDALPADISPADLPDTETITRFTGGADDVSLTDVKELAPHINNTNTLTALAVLHHPDVGAIHSQELQERADLTADETTSAITALLTLDLIRVSHVRDSIPFIEFNPFHNASPSE